MTDATQEYMRAAEARRDAHTQSLIDEARGPVETPNLDERLDDHNARIRAAIEAEAGSPPGFAVTLTGEDREAWLVFCSATQELQVAGQSLQDAQTRYREAVNKLSAIAAKRAG